MSEIKCELCGIINDPSDIESGNCGCWFEHPKELARAEKEEERMKDYEYAILDRVHEEEGGG